MGIAMSISISHVVEMTTTDQQLASAATIAHGIGCACRSCAAIRSARDAARLLR